MLDVATRKSDYERLDKILTVRVSDEYLEMLEAAGEKIPELRNREVAYLIRYAVKQTYEHLVDGAPGRN